MKSDFAALRIKGQFVSVSALEPPEDAIVDMNISREEAVRITEFLIHCLEREEKEDASSK